MSLLMGTRRALLSANRYAGTQALPRLFPEGGLFSDAVANLDDTSTVSQFSGTITKLPGEVRLDNSSAFSMPVPGGAKTGNFWIWMLSEYLGSYVGTYRPRWLSPTYSPAPARTQRGAAVFKFPAVAGSTTINVVTGNTFTGPLSVRAIQAYDMAAVLSAPADVYWFGGQSNIASTSNGGPIDPTLDVWPDKRCLYYPGVYPSFGLPIDEPLAAYAPMQTNGGVSGVSPATTFLAEIIKNTAPGRNAVVIMAAQGGRGLVDPASGWHVGGSDPTALNDALTQISAVLAVLPAGSAYKGAVWGQGESDSQADMSGYPPAFIPLRDTIDAAFGQGTKPWIILLPPPDATRPYQAELIQVQKQMAQDSGHAYAIPGVYVVDRPPGYMEDVTTHVNAPGQRIAGRLVAQLGKSVFLGL